MPEYGNKKKREPKKLTDAQKKAAAKAEKLRNKGAKKLSKGHKIRTKVEASLRGETPAMSENKIDRKSSRANKKYDKGFKSIRKAKSIDPKPPKLKNLKSLAEGKRMERKPRAEKLRSTIADERKDRLKELRSRKPLDTSSRVRKSGNY